MHDVTAHSMALLLLLVDQAMMLCRPQSPLHEDGARWHALLHIGISCGRSSIISVHLTVLLYRWLHIGPAVQHTSFCASPACSSSCSSSCIASLDCMSLSCLPPLHVSAAAHSACLCHCVVIFCQTVDIITAEIAQTSGNLPLEQVLLDCSKIVAVDMYLPRFCWNAYGQRSSGMRMASGVLVVKNIFYMKGHFHWNRMCSKPTASGIHGPMYCLVHLVQGFDQLSVYHGGIPFSPILTVAESDFAQC